MIATAQFKQEAIKDARNSVDATFDETSGGETAETIRTSDDVIGAFGTPAQRDSGYTTIFAKENPESLLNKDFQGFQTSAVEGT